MNTRVLYFLFLLVCCFTGGSLHAQQLAQRSHADMQDLEPDVEAASVIQPGEFIEEKVRQGLLIRVEVSKTSCVVGEPLKVVYKMYSRLNTNSQVMKRPSFTGFSVMEMVEAYDGKPVVERIKGVPYYVNLIRKVQLFPLQEGKFELDPAEVESIVHFVRVNIGEAPSVLDHKVTLRSEPVIIEVKPLPLKGQPDHYTGAVGKYTVKLKGPDTAIHQGELVKVRILVEGSGNINLLTPPEITWPEGVDTADPVVREMVDKFTFPLSGSKAFEYSFAAPDTGNIVIPGASLAYFDPQSQQYKEAVSDPLALTVKPGESEETRQLRANAMKQVDNGAIPKHLYWFGLVVLIIVSCLVYQFSQLRKKRSVEPKIHLPAKVEIPAPEEQLATARESLQSGNMKLFYHEIQHVLWNMAAVRCEIPPSLLNKQNVAARLAMQGVSDALVQQLLHLLNTCEWALYVPGHEQSDPRSLLDETRQVLEGLKPEA
ncbi:BatD family protein [Pseudoflavitalea rhizosphaerae]|uniref:BatD family protein n=1 Tax=Pseudoflavitalea rhizosphaerae TaxID=1884793 RepID=UPI000F8D8D44|nr:BatD family protein [Pseudoflavitalea rhizosphaerae]